jgi:hypothetical protein
MTRAIGKAGHQADHPSIQLNALAPQFQIHSKAMPVT